MKEIMLNVLRLSYAGVSVAGILAYLPTIKDIYSHKKQSANITTFLLWTITSGISCLYGVFILKDLLFIVIAGINFLACTIILFLSINLKKEITRQPNRA